MKKKMTAIMIGIGMLLLAGNTFAGVINKWSDPWFISLIRVSPLATTMEFTVAEFNETFTQCSNGTRWTLNEENPNYKAQAAGLMAAFLANKKISFLYQYDDVLLKPVSCDIIHFHVHE